jgi:hypothetical protein
MAAHLDKQFYCLTLGTKATMRLALDLTLTAGMS